ncbi:MAG: hypothetical protein ACR2QF_15375, partial [Geminicoccaceae bacterium]
MTAGGLTGAGNSPSAGATTPPPSTNSTFPTNSNSTRQAAADSKKPGGKPEQRPSGGGQANSVGEQNQKLQEFEAVMGRPPLGGRQVLLAGATATIAAGGTASSGAAGTVVRVVTTGAGAGVAAVGAAGAIVLMPSNSSLDQTLSIPGHPQFRITGKETEITRTLEVANA